MQPDRGVAPSPLPQSWAIMGVQLSDGRKMVAVRVESAMGAVVFFETPARARLIADQIRDTARTAESGLIVPGPNGHQGGS